MLELRVRAVARAAGPLAVVAAAAITSSPALAAPKQTLGSRVLREGMSGADVTALQSDLSKAGYKTPTNGVFGASTERSVKGFAHRYHLAATGVVNGSYVQQLKAVDALDAATTDATQGSGGIALSNGPVKVKVSVQAKRAKATADPTSAVSSVLAPVKRDGGSEHLGERTLHKGMHGHDVRVLQSYLTIAGYPTTIDGQFGPATRASTVRWQRAARLKANGVVTYADSLALRRDVAKAMTSTSSTNTSQPVSTTPAPTGKATINANGTANAPADAPPIVKDVIAAANQIIDKPYIYGGGHASFNDSGYDCSGAVSYALHGGNLLSAPEDSTELESYGQSGAGKWITVYADSGHAFMVVAGIAFDTAHYGPTTPGGSGPRWLNAAHATSNLSDGGDYIVRHPAGL